MPSRPMFTTPLRSEMIPPSAAKISGVVNVSPDAITADQVKTSRTFAEVWLVIASASGIAIRPSPTATPPSRRCLRIAQDRGADQSPRSRRARSTAPAVRTMIGGSVRIQAIAASTTAPMPIAT